MRSHIMKNIKKAVVALGIAMFLSSCTAIDFPSPSTSNNSISSNESISTSSPSSSETEETFEDMVYRELFTPSNDVRFSL